MDSAEDDVLCIGLCGIDAELVAVACEISYLDYLSCLVAVSEDSGISLFF
jgi:hypothetical protein